MSSITPTFKFNQPLNNEASSNDLESLDEIHPIELIIQSIIDNPLDSLQLKIEELQKSQFILIKRIELIEKNLSKIKQNFQVVDTNQLIFKINKIKKKLNNCLMILEVIENRIKPLIDM